MGTVEQCEICGQLVEAVDDPIALDLALEVLRSECERCGRMFGPCCNSVDDNYCVDCVGEEESDEPQTLRGLSLTRPWPVAFLNGGKVAAKRIENRSWRPPRGYDGYIALHSAQSFDSFAESVIKELTGRDGQIFDCEAGQIFAVANFIGVASRIEQVEAAQQCWFCGPYAWLLDDFRAIEPIGCKGALGLWRLHALAPIVWKRYQGSNRR